MNYRRYFFALVIVLCATAAYAAPDFSTQLNEDWKDKVFILKQCCAKKLTFNGQGELSSGPNNGLAPAAVLLKSLKIKKSTLEVRAKNAHLPFPGSDPAIRRGDAVEYQIKIKFSKPPITSDELNTVLQRTFARLSSKAELFPVYMQACAQGQILMYEGRLLCEFPGVWSRQQDLQKRRKIAKESASREVIGFKMLDGRYVQEKVLVYGMKRDVTPPKELSAPNPEYNDAARKAHINGDLELRVVINEQGRAEHIQVISPAGYGLDDQAVAAVSTWKFQPATYQGQPVSVAVMIEMHFRLYN